MLASMERISTWFLTTRLSASADAPPHTHKAAALSVHACGHAAGRMHDHALMHAAHAELSLAVQTSACMACPLAGSAFMTLANTYLQAARASFD
jgi:hypothetical protein